MKMHKLKNSKIDVSLLGFGCMRFPTIDGEINVVEVKKMLDYAYSKGVNYFDTAYPYHGGKSETVVRDIIKHYDRETFYLADKLPLWECKKEEDDLIKQFGDEYLEYKENTSMIFPMIY